MRFKCKKTRGGDLLFWHKWFAWYPVRIDSDTCAWLENVERRGNVEYTCEGDDYWNFEYRLIDETN